MQNPEDKSNDARPRLGLIQSRGLGDIIIALPIAKWHHDRGTDIYWPIDEKFLPSFKDSINYVNFIPFAFKPTLSGFYTTPLEMLHAQKCDKIINLYSYLSFLPINNSRLSRSLSFDQYKYAISDVPFKEKWNLIIERDPKKEIKLFSEKVTNNNYIVIHDKGSDTKASIQIPAKYKNHQQIIIDESTNSIFDWLYLIENAKCLFMIDSCFSNLVDQLELATEKYFILRSTSAYTPVLKSNWKYIKN